MGNWLELAAASRRAASMLIVEGYYRSAISRAYYAVYSKVTHELVRDGVTMPPDREGPAHATVRTLIEKNLKSLSRERRLALSGMVNVLYMMRVVADYSPSASVDSREGHHAASIMNKVFVTCPHFTYQPL
jgi:uncharacterized protein (UPF0332 family)